jgi:hypothetical protein
MSDKTTQILSKLVDNLTEKPELPLEEYMEGMYQVNEIYSAHLEDKVEVRKDVFRNVRDGRYGKRRILKEQCADMARELWTKGDNRQHHIMAKHLVTLVDLPDDIIKDTIKKVAKDMNRLDLIKGMEGHLANMKKK